MHSEENSPQTAAAYADSFDFCPFDLVQIVDAITQFGVGWQVSERFTAPVHGNSGTFAVIMCRTDVRVTPSPRASLRIAVWKCCSPDNWTEWTW